MGFAIAREARRRGAIVHLVAGPTTVPAPVVDTITRVRSAAEMHEAVNRASAEADVVVMAAAVADYTPAGGPAAAKIEKGGALTLTLERTVDVLAALGERRGAAERPVLVGFAAETGDPVARAQDKLRRKRVDLIVANDVSAGGSGFDVDTNQVTLVDAGGADALPLLTKDQVASAILDRIERRLARTAAAVSRA
jgi:phosphopantothenoylcysteine decarboxylase/phosphopantothenate--cysteine ligase